jgi:hypothetical protein
MKNGLLLTIALLVLIFHWACSDNNSSPSKPVGTLAGTNTPTPGVGTVVGTPVSPSSFTPTPTMYIAAPVFQSNVGTSASPNTMNNAGGVICVAEGEVKVGGDVTMYENFSTTGGQIALIPGSVGNEICIGVPTPQATPAWQGTTITLEMPLGLVQGYNAILDCPPGGTPTLYEQNPFWPGDYANYCSGYGGSPFNNPTGLAADNLGHYYVSDTGNGYVEEFGGPSGQGPPYSPAWLHRWNGSSSAKPFIAPGPIAFDANHYIWVADNGYTPAVIEIFASGATTFGAPAFNTNGYFNTVPGCVAYGIAIDNTVGCSSVPGPCVFVADGKNDQVEEYDALGNLLREWGDPHGPHEFFPFVPRSIALVGSPIQYIIVGDSGNDMLQLFDGP